MTVTYSGDHVGTLIVDSGMQVQTEIPGVTLDDAQRAFVELAAGKSPIITDSAGALHIVCGLRYIAAWWNPEPS